MTQAAVLKLYREEELRDVGLVSTSGGACLRGALRGTARRVAVKLLSCSADQSVQLAQMQEVLSLGQLGCERVLVPLGLFRAGGLLGSVWDWMAEGSLHSLLYESRLFVSMKNSVQKPPETIITTRSLSSVTGNISFLRRIPSINGRLTLETQLYPDLPSVLRLQVLLDVAEGLKFLHSIPLAHGALKATNVLLDQQYRAKLCDWGQQGVLDLRASVSGTGGPCFRDLAYMSPEVLEGGVPSVKSDMYSFGILIWEVLNRRRPCEGVGHLQTLILSTAEDTEPRAENQLLPPEIPHHHPLTQLIIRCCSSEPHQRPLAEECAVVIRKAMVTLDSEAAANAAHRLKTCKERALLSCKISTGWELPLDLNNLEGYSGSVHPKTLSSKTMPVNELCSSKVAPRSSRSDRTSPGGSPVPLTAARASPQVLDTPPVECCGDNPRWSRGTPTLPCHSPGLRQCAVACGVTPTRTRTPTPAPPNTPCGSPTTMMQAPLQHPCYGIRAVCPASSAGWSCCRLLRERREAIVHCMTEGRLNNLLDVLRSRRAVTRESYELITAALTLTARTRCLLDVCACLGENVAVLVASTLGLVSMGAARGHARPRTGCKGQAG